MSRRKTSLLYLLSFLNLAAVVSRGVPLFFEINHPLRWLVVGILAIYAALFATEAFINRVYPSYANIYFAIQTILILALLLTSQNDPRTTDFFALLFTPLCIQAVFELPRKISYGWVVGFALVSIIALILRYGVSEGVKFSFSYGLGFALITLLAVFFINSENASAELKQAHRQLQGYAARVEELTKTEERNRLARELHDSVTQSLYSLTLFSEAARHRAEEKDFENIEQQIEQIGAISLQALKEMRLLIYELQPPELERDGLVSALRRRLEAVEGRASVDARLVVDEFFRLPGDVEQELFRIAIEALNNALKHASAASVVVYLRQENGCIELEIVDDGVGFDLDTVLAHGGMGLKNIYERAKRLDGMVTIRSKSGEGTSIKIVVKALDDIDKQISLGEGEIYERANSRTDRR